MKKYYLIIYFSLLLIMVLAAGFFIPAENILADNSNAVVMTVKILVCGDGVREGWEECDNSDLGGRSCASLGYTGGALSCTPACEFNTSACATTTSPPSGGGGGGGYVAPLAETKVIFSGKAYPKTVVTLLKDAQIAATTIAGADANFQISVSGLSAGNYIFSIYSEDGKGLRSSLLTFPISVTQGATTNISGIFIAPTIDVDKSEVKRGDNIAIFGQSVPNSEITISVNSDEEFFAKTPADKNGVYLYNFDTAPLEIGQHFTKSKAALAGEISSFSKAVSFAVGTKTTPKETPRSLKSDLNGDNRINLVDFSIAAYWYKRPISAEFSKKESEFLNGDGRVDLIDFSIMAYYWTG
ncbi:hypothetical protein L6249_00520 [Candidatus Parcubacteria bacterium]|nr:hypothetical protein [Candidatus Parcubacteria bacterium]